MAQDVSRPGPSGLIDITRFVGKELKNYAQIETTSEMSRFGFPV